MSRFSPDSPDWRAAKEVLAQRLADAREELESEQKTHDQTQFLRGRISELKELLALKDDEPTDAQRRKLAPPKYT